MSDEELVLEELGRGDATATELAERTGLDRPVVIEALKDLWVAGTVEPAQRPVVYQRVS